MGLIVHALITKKQQNDSFMEIECNQYKWNCIIQSIVVQRSAVYYANPEIRNVSLEMLISPFTRFKFPIALRYQ